MAKDDYHVLVFYILKYLYECLKAGQDPEEKVLSLQYYPKEINEEYLNYIYRNLKKTQYIDGLEVINFPRLGEKDNLEFIKDFENIVITPKGIEYLQENPLMKKAYDIVKDFKPW